MLARTGERDVEAVGKPQNVEFSHEKALCFQGPNSQKETFFTASLDDRILGVRHERHTIRHAHSRHPRHRM